MAHGLSGRACVDGRNNYLLRVKWLDGLGKITLFNFEDVRIWEGKVIFLVHSFGVDRFCLFVL